MKEYAKIILSIIPALTSRIAFAINGARKSTVSIPAMFYKSSFSLKGSDNKLKLTGKTEKTNFFIEGSGNTVTLNSTEVSNSIITLTGNNNSFHCEEGVLLRSTVVTIRGNSCNIRIGKATTFGGARLISAGENNEIIIGAGCLFADLIEVWASDTHPIYNDKNEIINKEKSIHIGDKVWVGARAIILKGVTIESGSVVGMGGAWSKTG